MRDTTRKAHEAMYIFQHGDWYLHEPWQEPVGWSDGQLEVGIDAITTDLQVRALRQAALAERNRADQETSATVRAVFNIAAERMEYHADQLENNE